MSVRKNAGTKTAAVLGGRKPTDFERRMSRSDMYCIALAIAMLVACMLGTAYWHKVTKFFDALL